MRLTFFVNNLAFFVSHRLPIALAMRDDGAEVSLVTGQAGSAKMEALAESELSLTGIYHGRLAFGSQSLNPFTELRAIADLVLYLRRTRPDVLHCASPKGVLYGGIAARFCQIPALVLAVTGMGYTFTTTDRLSLRRRLLALMFGRLARFAFNHKNKRVIVQNLDDWAQLKRVGYARSEELRLIPGSGVDLSAYAGVDPAAKQKIVLFPARILRDKGAMEFVEAARLLAGRAPGWRFIMAGAADYQNPSSIDRALIERWQADGIIEWLGHVEDMVSLFNSASIACLPSFREGMPKALIEAAAAGCAIVTTDAIGCKEAIIPGETGDLVPVGNATALAECLLALIQDPTRRISYGAAGMNFARSQYDISIVIENTKKIYNELLVKMEEF